VMPPEGFPQSVLHRSPEGAATDPDPAPAPSQICHNLPIGLEMTVGEVIWCRGEAGRELGKMWRRGEGV
jgi:hypothetical protein